VAQPSIFKFHDCWLIKQSHRLTYTEFHTEQQVQNPGLRGDGCVPVKALTEDSSANKDTNFGGKNKKRPDVLSFSDLETLSHT
jgi:hypothetical protein